MGVNTIELEQKRHIWNIKMFIISFTLSNLISGVIYDTYINYLQEVARPVATSFWSYYGYATFISAIMVLLVNKIGYKWTLLFCPVTSLGALVAILALDMPALYQVMTVLSLVGLQLHYAILAPYIAAHTNKTNRTLWYSRTYWIGYAGWALTTYLGGYLTVSRFATRIGQGFPKAQELTRYIEELSPAFRELYLKANGDVLFMTAVIAGVSFIPVLLIRENKLDYASDNEMQAKESFKEKFQLIYKTITDKYVLSFVGYWALISFGMGLFTPYYTIFLNRNLHIDRSTASLLVSISYIAMVIFIIFTPKLVKKYGQIVILAGVLLLSIPFMLVIANGDKFGIFMIPIVGISLFMRSGLANLGGPIDSSLPMEVVPKRLRPTMSLIVNSVAGLMSIVAGSFTGNILFKDQSGYKNGYYLAGILYVVASLILIKVFMKKYNFPTDSEN
jgi:hypothetical protein